MKRCFKKTSAIILHGDATEKTVSGGFSNFRKPILGDFLPSPPYLNPDYFLSGFFV